MKNKEWLKECIERAADSHSFRMVQDTSVLALIDQLEEPEQEKVFVPQFVADFITEIKPNFNIRTVFTLKNNKHEQGQEWALDNPDVFARAWLDGYTVEKEKLYRVRLPMTVWDEESSELQEHWYYLVYDNTSDETRLTQSLRAYDRYQHYQTDLSETSIKSIDERYWAFAEEVTE